MNQLNLGEEGTEGRRELELSGSIIVGAVVVELLGGVRQAQQKTAAEVREN